MYIRYFYRHKPLCLVLLPDTMTSEPSPSHLAHHGSLSTMDTFKISFETSTILWVFLATALAYRFWNQHRFKLPPLINPGKLSDLTGAAVKKDFVQRSNELIQEGSKRFGEQPYSMMSDTGRVIMLAPKHVDEIRNQPNLSFLKNTEHVSTNVCEVEKNTDWNNIGLPRLPAWFRTIWCRHCNSNSRHGS